MATAAAITRPAWTKKVPWNDRAGRFSPLKTITLVLVSLPALWLVYKVIFIGLPGRPVIEAVHFVGDWTVYFLLITLAITPARRLLDWNKLILIRRILGLSALTYILVHFTLYVIDSRFDIGFVANEIVFRVYLSIGFLAILGWIALGVTSTDGMFKRMGSQSWNTLHNLIYFIVPLAILHYYMQSKLDVTQPVLMSGFFFWLMGYRLIVKLGYKQGILPLLGLSVAAGLLTAAVEVAWYGLATGINVRRVLSANLDFRFQIRPAWWVFATGVAVAIVAEIRRRFGRVRSPQRPARAT
jgi:sulfoxide reductase heme-binding subunit YedZ